MNDPRRRLAVLTALPDELSAVAAAQPPKDALLVRGGMGFEAALQATHKLLAAPHPPELICTTGLCGGLQDGLEVGDIVLATLLATDDQPQTYAVAPTDKLRAALEAAGIRLLCATCVSVRQPVLTSAHKRQLGAQVRAAAVDTESYAIAGAAGTRAQVICLRVVSDSVTDELPAQVLEFLDPQGNVRMAKVARYVLGGPAHVETLRQLKRRRDKALANLTAAWKVVWPWWVKNNEQN